MPNLSEVVNVKTQLRTGQAPARRFGEGLLVTIDGRLPAGGAGKLVRLERSVDVPTNLDTASDSYNAAVAWFAQDPAPSALQVVRWASMDVPTEIEGGMSVVLADVTVADLGFVIAGNAVSVDASSAADFAAVAALLETAIQALATGAAADSRFAGADVTYADGAFTLELAGADDIGLASAPLTGTDGAALLGWTAEAGATYKQGSDAESIADLITRAEEISDGFYFVVLDDGVPSVVGTGTDQVFTARALDARATLGTMLYIASSNEDAALDATDVASEAYLLSVMESPRTVGTWERSGRLEAVRLAAVLSSQDFRLPGSLITAKFRTLTGQPGAGLTGSQEAALRVKRFNFYAIFGGRPIFAEGYTLSPDWWADARIWVDWLANEIQTEVFNLFVSTNRVPITSYGVALYKDALVRALERGVRNGGIAPGTVSAALRAEIRQATGNPDFDGALASGYLVHIDSLTDEVAYPQSSRDQRDTPPTRIFVKYSSAFHQADITIIIEG